MTGSDGARVQHLSAGKTTHITDRREFLLYFYFDEVSGQKPPPKKPYTLTLGVRWRLGNAFLLNTFAKIGSSNPPLSDSDWGEWCYRFLEARFYDHGVASHMQM